MEKKQYSIGEKVMPLIQELREGTAHYNFILIKAGTGKGKTTFVLEELLKYAMARGEKILYLVNRTALKKQIETRIKTMAQESIYHYDKIGKSVLVETYAKLETCLCLHKCCRNCDKCWQHCKFSKKFFSYIILDEDHYFYQDALFNTNTWLSFEWLMMPDKKVIKIGMSATPEDIHGYLRNYVREAYQDISSRGEIQTYPYVGSGLFGYAKPQFYFLGNYAANLEDGEDTVIDRQQWDTDYSYVKTYSFRDVGDIYGIIAGISSEEKVLIFVDSIERGKKIEKLLKGSDVVFVDSSYRNDKSSEMWQDVHEIVDFEKFSSRILITTSTLDNGINISDGNCRHVIIMTDERTSFLQMLGRKRVSAYDTIHVYMYLGEVGKFRKRQGEMEQLCDLYWRLNGMTCQELNRYVLQEKRLDFSLVGKIYFWDNRPIYNFPGGSMEIGFRPNRFSVFHACNKVKSLERIINGMEQDPEYFMKEQMSWLGLNPNSVNIVKSAEEIMEEKKARLIQIFEEKVRKSGDFDKRDKNEFIDNIADDIMSLYSYNSESDSKKPNLKNGVSGINNIMAKVELPYRFKELGNKNAERKNKYKIIRLE